MFQVAVPDLKLVWTVWFLLRLCGVSICVWYLVLVLLCPLQSLLIGLGWFGLPSWCHWVLMECPLAGFVHDPFLDRARVRVRAGVGRLRYGGGHRKVLDPNPST